MRREERVTVQGPVKEQQPDGMSHRGVMQKLEFLQFKFCTKFLYAICLVLFRICAGIREALQVPTVSHEQLLGTIHSLFAHF